MTTLGSKLLSSSGGAWVGFFAASGNQFAQNLAGTLVAPSDGWITGIGAFMRVASGTPTLYLAAWHSGDGSAPGNLLGRTGLITVSGSGSNHEGAIAAVSTLGGGADNQGAIRVKAGWKLFFGGTIQSGDIDVLATTILATNYEYWHRTPGAVLPTDPFAHTSNPDSAYRFAIYAEFTPDSAPNAPVSLSPADAGTFAGTLPVFSGTFSDADTGSPTLDKISAYEFEVQDNADQSPLWTGAGATFLAGTNEQTSGNYSAVYNGSALSPGDVLRWRTRTADLSGLWGAYSAWRTLTLQAAGPQVAITSPLADAKIDGPSGEIDWSGTYTHATSTSSTHVQVRVLSGTQVYRESPEIAKVVSHNASFTITDTEAALGTLGAGLALSVQIRAKAGGVWGEWSTARAFTTNAIPTVPASLQPPAGSIATSYPKLTFVSSDADDTEGTDVEWEIEITRPDLTVHTYTTTNWDATAGEAYLQLSVTHVPNTGLYRWRARARDISASDGYSAWSEPVTFTYATGLTVTITSPTEGQVLTTATPTFTFTISAGTVTYRRLWLYEKDTTTLRYDSGVLTGAGGITPDAGVLLNAASYDAVIWAANDSAVEGTSLRREFSVSFAAATGPAGLTLATYSHPRDPEPTSVLVSWQPTDVPYDQFTGYAVRRWDDGAAQNTGRLLKIITQPQQTRYLDAAIPASQRQRYAVSVLKKDGTESALVAGSIDLDLSVVVIQSATSPDQRVVLRWKPATIRGTPEQEAETLTTWGSSGKPVVVFGGGVRSVIEGSFTLLSDDYGTRQEHFAAGDALYRAQEPVIFRDERNRLFGVLRQWDWEQFDNKDTIRLRVEEIAYVEGVSAA